jgi:hypothetical protein
MWVSGREGVGVKNEKKNRKTSYLPIIYRRDIQTAFDVDSSENTIAYRIFCFAGLSTHTHTHRFFLLYHHLSSS